MKLLLFPVDISATSSSYSLTIYLPSSNDKLDDCRWKLTYQTTNMLALYIELYECLFVHVYVRVYAFVFLHEHYY